MCLYVFLLDSVFLWYNDGYSSDRSMRMQKVYSPGIGLLVMYNVIYNY